MESTLSVDAIRRNSAAVLVPPSTPGLSRPVRPAWECGLVNPTAMPSNARSASIMAASSAVAACAAWFKCSQWLPLFVGLVPASAHATHLEVDEPRQRHLANNPYSRNTDAKHIPQRRVALDNAEDESHHTVNIGHGVQQHKRAEGVRCAGILGVDAWYSHTGEMFSARLASCTPCRVLP